MFRLKITLLIDITDDLSDAAAKESVRSKVEAAVCMFPIIQFKHRTFLDLFNHIMYRRCIIIIIIAQLKIIFRSYFSAYFILSQ